MKTAKKLIPLKDYPQGLFMYKDTLCVKTEYGTDSYIVWSGEAFWGGSKTLSGIGDVMILPIDDSFVQKIEKRGGKRFNALARKIKNKRGDK